MFEAAMLALIQLSLKSLAVYVFIRGMFSFYEAEFNSVGIVFR